MALLPLDAHVPAHLRRSRHDLDLHELAQSDGRSARRGDHVAVGPRERRGGDRRGRGKARTSRPRRRRPRPRPRPSPLRMRTRPRTRRRRSRATPKRTLRGPRTRSNPSRSRSKASRAGSRCCLVIPAASGSCPDWTPSCCTCAARATGRTVARPSCESWIPARTMPTSATSWCWPAFRPTSSGERVRSSWFGRAAAGAWSVPRRVRS